MLVNDALVVDRVRRASGLVLRSVLLLCTLVIGAHPGGALAETVSGTNAVNIRSCASLDCEVVAIAPLGSPLVVTGGEQGGWLPVSWDGVDGFAFNLYVAPDGQAPWFRQGDPACNTVALIFNIGIGEEPSASILDTLVTNEVSATMFPMGWWATVYPDYLLALDEAGFVIGTHGDQRIFLTTMDDATVRTDIANSAAAIESVIGRPIDPWFTPYAADTDERIRGIAAGMGLMPVGWTIAAADYGADATADGVYARVMGAVQPGAVIEFHLDGPATEASTAAVLPLIVRDLRAQGFELVTIPELALPCAA